MMDTWKEGDLDSNGGDAKLKGGARIGSGSSIVSSLRLEGWLEKKSRNGIPKVRGWKRRYFILKGNELRYFERCRDSSYGPVPINEKGAVDLRLLRSVVPRNEAKYSGRMTRFDLFFHCHAGAGKYLTAERDDKRSPKQPMSLECDNFAFGQDILTASTGLITCASAYLFRSKTSLQPTAANSEKRRCL